MSFWGGRCLKPSTRLRPGLFQIDLEEPCQLLDLNKKASPISGSESVSVSTATMCDWAEDWYEASAEINWERIVVMTLSRFVGS